MSQGEKTTGSGSTRVRSDRGVISIEMVLLLPLAFSLLFLALQGAMYYQGRTVALSAAQEGARGAAAYEASEGDGRAAALTFTGRTGESLMTPHVAIERDSHAGTVTVAVTGTTKSFVPGWDPEVTQSASRSIEEFTAPEEGHSATSDNTMPPSW